MAYRRARYLLHGNRIRAHLDEKHKTVSWLAAQLRVSRPYLSQLLNRRRTASPPVRERLLGLALFHGVAEDQLWEIEKVE